MTNASLWRILGVISVSAVWTTTQFVVTADFLDPIVNYLAYVGIDASNAKRIDVLKSIIAFIIYAVIATLYFIFFHPLVMRAWRFRLMPEFEKLIERISKYHSATASDINIMSAAIPPTKRNNSLEGEGFCGNAWSLKRPVAGSKYLPFLYRIIKDPKYKERDILESTRSFMCLPIAKQSGRPNAIDDVAAVLVVDSERRRDFMMSGNMVKVINSHLRILRAALFTHVEYLRYKEPAL